MKYSEIIILWLKTFLEYGKKNIVLLIILFIMLRILAGNNLIAFQAFGIVVLSFMLHELGHMIFLRYYKIKFTCIVQKSAFIIQTSKEIINDQPLSIQRNMALSGFIGSVFFNLFAIFLNKSMAILILLSIIIIFCEVCNILFGHDGEYFRKEN